MLFRSPTSPCEVKMEILMIDGLGATTRTYTFYDVWPKLILPSEMSNNNIDFLKLQVDFNYRKYDYN